MRQKEVFKKIGAIIQELSDQYEYLKTVEDDLNDLELELFVSNAHFLTDHIEVLCKLNLQNRVKRPLPEKPASEPLAEKPASVPLPEKPVKAREEKYFEPVVQQTKHGAEIEIEKPTINDFFKPVELEVTPLEPVEDAPVPEIDLSSAAPSDTYSYIREEPETIRHELVLDEAMMLDEDEQPEVEIEPVRESKKRKSAASVVAEEPVFETEETKPVEVKPETVAEAPVADDEVLTVNQKMQSQLGDKGTRTEQLSVKPISDIKLAITLNDKLLYVKDLFNGYNLAYSEAIEILNRFNTFEEASRFLNTNYVTKNNWESKAATVEKFYALLRRRYA
jgi:hypothetical protein